MRCRTTETASSFILFVLLFGAFLAGCGGGGASGSGPNLPVYTDTTPKMLSWSPPTEFQDNTSLVPNRDLAGYNIYIKPASTAFSENDVECAFVSPRNTSLDLIPVCRLNGLFPGSYRVSVRAIAANGMMSDFSPTASFTLK
jgi:hypothetical protein